MGLLSRLGGGQPMQPPGMPMQMSGMPSRPPMQPQMPPPMAPQQVGMGMPNSFSGSPAFQQQLASMIARQPFNAPRILPSQQVASFNPNAPAPDAYSVAGMSGRFGNEGVRMMRY